MSPRTSTLVVAAGLSLVASVLGAPALAADNDGLEDPNGCGGIFGDVPQGTVVVLPPGLPPSTDTPPVYSSDPTTGAPRSNVYECLNGRWVLITSFRETPLQVAADQGSVSVAEGSLATVTGTYEYGGDEPLTLDASFGVLVDHGDGTWSWSTTADDGPATYPVTITASAGQHQAFAVVDLDVTNVAPTVTSVVPSTPIALVGQAVSFTGTATDPSAADTAAGFTWSPGAPVAFDTCGTHTVSATATDKDGGVSVPVTSTPVDVLDAAVAPPLAPGVRNPVRAGQVVPVRVTLGCSGAARTGLSPTLTLVRGEVGQATPTDDPAQVVPAVGAAGDAGGVMRSAGGAYLYNLRVPDAAPGSLFTIRVRPAPGAAPLSVVVQLR